jgi:hypothetical protein
MNHSPLQRDKNGLAFYPFSSGNCCSSPGETELYKIALSLRNELKPLKKKEIIQIKEKGLAAFLCLKMRKPHNSLQKFLIYRK